MNCIFFKIFKKKRISHFNAKNFDKNVYGFHENYMYTIMGKEIIDQKIKSIDIKTLKENLLLNQSEI